MHRLMSETLFQIYHKTLLKVERYMQGVVRQNSPHKTSIFQVYHYFTIVNITYKHPEDTFRFTGRF